MADLWENLAGQGNAAGPMPKKEKTGMDQANSMIQNRDFLNLLAGIGSSLNPNGIGAQIGKPVMAINQVQAMGAATAKQNEQSNNMMKALIDAIAGPGNITNLSVHPDGTVKIGGKNGDPSGTNNNPKETKSENSALGTVGQVPEKASYSPNKEDEVDFTTLGY